MDHRSRFTTLNAQYENFLYAPVCEEANGMRLSVISALARMNVDPWQEATRLAAMPKAIAEKTLLSILDLVSGRSWKSPEAAAIAARLVRLLPQPGQATTTTATGTANTATGTGTAKIIDLRKSHWLVWLFFALAMSFMAQRHQETTTNTPATTSQTGAPSQAKTSTTTPNPIGLSR